MCILRSGMAVSLLLSCLTFQHPGSGGSPTNDCEHGCVLCEVQKWREELAERECLDKMLKEHVVTARVPVKARPPCWFPLRQDRPLFLPHLLSEGLLFSGTPSSQRWRVGHAS